MILFLIGWLPVTTPFITSMCAQSRRLEAGLCLDPRPRAVNALSCCTSTFARGGLLIFCLILSEIARVSFFMENTLSQCLCMQPFSALVPARCMGLTGSI